MKKFIVLYHAPADAMEQTASLSPEDQAKGMEAWMEWARNCGDHLVDLGMPLTNGEQMSSDGSTASDTGNVTGYSIIQAENMEEAEALLKNHPHLGWNPDCTIGLHETMMLPGM